MLWEEHRPGRGGRVAGHSGHPSNVTRCLLARWRAPRVSDEHAALPAGRSRGALGSLRLPIELPIDFA